jgi:triosephosphate isomerase
MATPTRRPIVAGNWKMNKTVAEALALVRELQGALGQAADRVEVVLAPPFTALHPVGQALGGGALKLAAQNCHWEASGAFTGEVAPGMLRELGCSYVIVGHSERRQLFGETDEAVNKRARAVLRAGMQPIICVGETLAEREANRTLEVVGRQVRGAFAGFSAAEVGGVVVAYEPVWAIGTGRNATPAQAGEAHAHIRARLRQWFGGAAADQCHVIYGGSVKPDNIHDLMLLPDVDGALVGGASLDIRAFAEIVARSRQSAV